MFVFCGHTHGAGRCMPVPGISVVTGAAEYGVPAAQQIIEVP